MRWCRAAVVVAAVTALVACGTPRVTEGAATTAAAPSGRSVFASATAGDCLTWPEGTPDEVTVVRCDGEHRIEVSAAIDLSSELGPDAPPPTPSAIQKISERRCAPAARNHLGPRFDPNGRFTATMLWSGEQLWRAGERHVLCGLQLSGAYGMPTAFTGTIADQDQSRVWPPGTCLGIEPTTKQANDFPVSCAAPHAFEVTGSIDVGAEFPGPLPAEPAQDAFVRDACTRITDAYLAPRTLRQTTLSLVYGTVTQQSWDAGSRRVSCTIGAPTEGGWAVLLNDAKGNLLIDGRPPAP